MTCWFSAGKELTPNHPLWFPLLDSLPKLGGSQPSPLLFSLFSVWWQFPFNPRKVKLLAGDLRAAQKPGSSPLSAGTLSVACSACHVRSWTSSGGIGRWTVWSATPRCTSPLWTTPSGRRTHVSAGKRPLGGFGQGFRLFIFWNLRKWRDRLLFVGTLVFAGRWYNDLTRGVTLS